MSHNIIPSGEILVKATDELNKQVAQELFLPDEPKHTTAQIFDQGATIGTRSIRKNNKDSESSSP